MDAPLLALTRGRPDGLPGRAPTDAAVEDDLALALRLADVADAETLSRFDAADLQVSKKADRFLPKLTCRTPVVPAELLNQAGIVGGALAVHRHKDKHGTEGQHVPPKRKG